MELAFRYLLKELLFPFPKSLVAYLPSILYMANTWETDPLSREEAIETL